MNTENKLISWYRKHIRPFFSDHEPDKLSEFDKDCQRIEKIEADLQQQLPVCFLGGSGVGKVLKPLLRDLDPWVRLYAVEGLASGETAVSEEDVKHLLADDRWLNRAGAVKAIVAGGSDRSLDTIVRTLEDEHAAVRATAHHGLASWKTTAVIPAILKGMDALGGEGQGLALDVLKKLTKQDFATTAEWKAWWAANRGNIRLPPINERFQPEGRKKP